MGEELQVASDHSLALPAECDALAVIFGQATPDWDTAPLGVQDLQSEALDWDQQRLIAIQRLRLKANVVDAEKRSSSVETRIQEMVRRLVSCVG